MKSSVMLVYREGIGVYSTSLGFLCSLVWWFGCTGQWWWWPSDGMLCVIFWMVVG